MTISLYSVKLPLIPEITQEMNSWLPDNLNEAADKRKVEFLAGRYCAIKAADKLGFSLSSLPRNHTREPIWPESLVGSITHTDKFALSCVSRNENYLSIGIDAEEIISGDIFTEIKRHICTVDEQVLINSFKEDQRETVFTIIFSAKEAFYKAAFPLVRRYIDFLDVRLTKFNFEDRIFTLEVIKNLNSDFPIGKVLNGFYYNYENSIVSLLPIPKSDINIRNVCVYS